MGIGAIHWVIDPNDDPWLRGLNASEPVLHWHGDRIRLPVEASLLGSSLHCPEQLFRIGDHAAGVQCHFEVSAESLKRWIADDQDYVVGALGRDGPALLKHQWVTIGATIERRGRIAMGQILTDLTNQLNTENKTFL